MAVGPDQAVFDESEKHRIGDDHHVDGFTAPQPVRDRGLSRAYGCCDGHKFFLGQEFEPGNERTIRRCESARAITRISSVMVFIFFVLIA